MQLLAPGDIFLLRGSGRLADIGAAGGLFGHVMVVTSLPHCVRRGTAEAESLRTVWPRGEDCEEVWRVGTIESTRRERGLHETDSIVAITPRAGGGGGLVLVGECTRQGELSVVDSDEVVDVWQAPAELRSRVHPGMVQEVVAEMKAQMREANWSMLTAARAALTAARVSAGDDKVRTLEEIQACWSNGPICTSVALICWQRCLCRVAAAANGGISYAAVAEAVDLILRWMPLKADRTLPGDLVCMLMATGWRLMEQVAQPEGPGVRPQLARKPGWPVPESLACKQQQLQASLAAEAYGVRLGELVSL